jgi:hypothetical protein
VVKFHTHIKQNCAEIHRFFTRLLFKSWIKYVPSWNKTSTFKNWIQSLPSLVHSFISGSTVLVRTLSASQTRSFLIYLDTRRTQGEWSGPCIGLCLHGVTQYRKTRTTTMPQAGACLVRAINSKYRQIFISRRVFFFCRVGITNVQNNFDK